MSEFKVIFELDSGAFYTFVEAESCMEALQKAVKEAQDCVYCSGDPLRATKITVWTGEY